MTDKQKRFLLQQFAAGTISPKDRHILEREALDDPFLFESLEGYATSQVTLTEFYRNESALNLPIKRFLSIAASFLLLAAAVLAFNSVWQQESALEISDASLERHATKEQEALAYEDVDSESINSDNRFIENAIPNSAIKPRRKAQSQKASVQESFDKVGEESEKAVLRQDIPQRQVSPAGIDDTSSTILMSQSVSRTPKMEQEDLNEHQNQLIKVDASTPSVSGSASNDRTIVFGESLDELDTIELTSKEIVQADDKITDGPHVITTYPRNVHGNILDTRNRPVVGANITNLQSFAATVSDNEGNYELQIDSQKDSIEFSHTGFLTTIIPAKTIEYNPINMKLQEAFGLADTNQIGVDFDSLANDNISYKTRLYPLIGEYKLKQQIKAAIVEAGCKKFNEISITVHMKRFGDLGRIQVKPSMGKQCDRVIVKTVREGGKWTSFPDGVWGKHTLTLSSNK